MLKLIIKELEHHVPFTIFGAITGVLALFLCLNLPKGYSHILFYTFHPMHVFLSAFVTASMYRLHKKNTNIILLFVISFAGSIGIATISDSLIPFLGEKLLGMPHAHAHIGFIEEWWLVNPLAIIGIVAACYFPSTKLPHAGHVLLSTWASLFHILMAMSKSISFLIIVSIFFILFIAVWVPCCMSDIIFPLLFVRRPGDNL